MTETEHQRYLDRIKRREKERRKEDETRQGDVRSMERCVAEDHVGRRFQRRGQYAIVCGRSWRRTYFTNDHEVGDLVESVLRLIEDEAGEYDPSAEARRLADRYPFEEAARRLYEYLDPDYTDKNPDAAWDWCQQLVRDYCRE